MLYAQNNKCAICERDMSEYGKIFCVDHNRTTGKVRGLLCDPNIVTGKQIGRAHV